ncbi:hypothetical protein EYF80_030034 [Liparis tanakae]|uniref:Uncharacterized protein n=1 Tax=Liparis tanakae TaxID=230148 RepID=A0A4Z2H2F5_9TELE|nr:hypothetical protein EYF80_030034 [Liparis tanakae]
MDAHTHPPHPSRPVDALVQAETGSGAATDLLGLYLREPDRTGSSEQRCLSRKRPGDEGDTHLLPPLPRDPWDAAWTDHEGADGTSLSLTSRSEDSHLLSLEPLWAFSTSQSLSATQARGPVPPPGAGGAGHTRWTLHESQRQVIMNPKASWV